MITLSNPNPQLTGKPKYGEGKNGYPDDMILATATGKIKNRERVKYFFRPEYIPIKEKEIYKGNILGLILNAKALNIIENIIKLLNSIRLFMYKFDINIGNNITTRSGDGELADPNLIEKINIIEKLKIIYNLDEVLFLISYKLINI